MKLKSLLVPLSLAALAPSGIAQAAPELDQCPAKQYKRCSSFLTNVEIGEHEPIIDNHLAGFTRSKGTWKISVRYQPETQCAKVNILLNMGPIDSLRQYKETFRNGRGVISDSGPFMHKIDDLETALQIPHSTCHVPDQPPSKREAQAEGEMPKDEQERLTLEETRKRLAAEKEREQWDLEKEREKLALERERMALERETSPARERDRLAQAQKRHRAQTDQQRMHAWFKRQQKRLDEIQTQEELEKEREKRRNEEQAGTDAMMTGLALGVIGGVLGALTDESSRSLNFNPGAFSGGGTGCEQIGERLARNLEKVNAVHGNSMCGMGRGMAQALTQARNDLVAMNCASSQELAEMDRSIREAQATAQVSCSGN